MKKQSLLENGKSEKELFATGDKSVPDDSVDNASTNNDSAGNEARAALEMRANFDADAWERALAQRNAMGSLPGSDTKAARAPQAIPPFRRMPGPRLPGGWPPGVPHSTPPTIFISVPPPPVYMPSVTLTGKATAGWNASQEDWNAINDIYVQLDTSATHIEADWAHGVGDSPGEVSWSVTVPLATTGTHSVLATVVTDAGSAHSRMNFSVSANPVGWWDVGPANISGCVLQVIIDPTNSNRLYAAACDGGIWKLPSVAAYPTFNWVPLTDRQPCLSVASVAVARADSRIVYYADALQYVYRSTDSGSSWNLTSTMKIGWVYKLIVHPDDTDTVYAATDTGMWFSGDAGGQWTNLYPGKITDAAMDPVDASILYVGAPPIGVLKTYSSGMVWQVVLPWSASAATWPMIKVAVGALGSDATRTIAAKLNEEVWLNHAGGRNGVNSGGWVRKATLANMGQWDWDHVIAVNPFDDSVVLVGGQTLYRTPDGGATWPAVVQAGGGDQTHEDQQSLAFDPTAPGIVYLSNDGGVWRSTDAGQTWATGGADDISLRLT